MRAFTTLWFGQFVSTVGSGLTGFGVGVWIYQKTGSATAFALSNVFYLVPFILLGPVAGALVDRWDRRRVIILADVGQAMGALTMALLLRTGQLQIWQIYLIVALSSVLKAFQRPAYMASVSLLVPREQLGRAGGMAQASDAVSNLAAPIVAGFLVVTIGLSGVVLIDFATFLFAVATAWLIHIPRPKLSTPHSELGQSKLWQEIVFGWKYIVAREGLLGLLVIYAFLNLFNNAAGVLTTPMVLSFTSANVLGAVLAAGGAGLLTGSLLMSVWGGPKRLIHGAIGFVFVIGAAHIISGLQPSAVFVALGRFLFFFGFAVLSASAGVLWQRKVAPEVQGRVFATRFMISASIEPIGEASIGVLVDKFFEPLMAVGGPLAGSLGRIIGVGAGRGMGLVNLLMGALIILLGVIGYLNSRVRLIEDELPDALPEQRAALPPLETASPEVIPA